MRQIDIFGPHRCRFYLGIGEARWLARGEVRGPVFIAVPRACERKSPYPRVDPFQPWAADSRAFTMLSTHGTWQVTLEQYAAMMTRLDREIGPADWASPQDYMCEAKVLIKTGLTVRDHQELTVRRFAQLRALAPERHWIPVLQGWELDDYKRHIDDYERLLDIDLRAEPLVGIGSTCRRQGTRAAGEIYKMVHDEGIRAHGYGVSLAGMQKGQHHYLASADSQAGSFAARMESVAPTWAANQIEILEIYRDRIEAAIDEDAGRMKDAKARWRDAMTWTKASRRAA